MGKMLILLLILIIICILWTLPLYLVVNLVLWLFNSTLRITLLQSFSLSLLVALLQRMLFGKKGEN